MDDQLTKISRPKGRPSKTSLLESLPSFPGPTLDEVLAYTDEQVADGFDALAVEPRPPFWTDDAQRNWTLFGGDPLHEPKSVELVTPEEMAKAESRAVASYASSARCELYYEMLLDWCKSLQHAVLLKMIEAKTGQKLRESTIRYALASQFQRQLAGTLFAEVVQVSEKYQGIKPQQPMEQKQCNKGGRKR
jgi:hypothetical protein